MDERYWMVVRVDLSDPSLGEEFDKWYNEVHLPEVVEQPGIRAAFRGVRVDEGRPQGEQGQRYMALYEIDHPSVFDTKFFRELSPGWGKWRQYITNWSRTFYKVAASSGSGFRPLE